MDVDGDGNIAEDEVLTESLYDGAGRIRKTRSPHLGSDGGYSAVLTEYDVLGRVTRQSVPTEVDSSWDPDGDDLSRGFIWNSQEYDWMGRTTRTIPSDSNGSDGKDTLISYAGCGCAGGLITTVEGPMVPTDVNPATEARRKQKSYADILGRTFKTETFEWNGTDEYLRTEVDLNGRDQAVEITQTDLSGEDPVAQVSTVTFDGHGRMATSHKPEQRDNSDNLKYTAYTYYKDGSISTVTDGRGAVTTYTYENASGTPKRPLVTGISWTVPGGSGITDPTDVSFTFDNAGNRTGMTDGLGTVAYTYNSLSQLTAETRDFTDTLASSPGGNGVYELEYSYHIGGQLKSYKDPWDEEIAYTNDKTGRLSEVTGTSFGGVTTYATDASYRAWGALKYLEKGDDKTEIEYNDRLQASSMLVVQTVSPFNKSFEKDYEYFADGRLRLVDENKDSNSNRFDRSFTYDHQGRVKDARSGVEAHGGYETDLTKLPYRQTYTFNAFGNITSRVSTVWDYEEDWNFENSVVNNRDVGLSYDFDGRVVSDPRSDGDGDPISYVHDAAGLMVKTSRYYEGYETVVGHDGDGREMKRSRRLEDPEEESEWLDWETSYFIHSSILGKLISETKGTGAKQSTYVYGAGSLVAQQAITSQETEWVSWKFTDASGFSSRGAGASEELDGLGNNVGGMRAISPPQRRDSSHTPMQGITWDDVTMGECELDGIVTPCSMLRGMTEALQARVRYFDGTISAPIDIDRTLPGREIRFFIPDSVYHSTSVQPVDPNAPLPPAASFFTPSGIWFTFAIPGVQTNSRLTEIEVRGLRGSIRNLLSRRDCATFIEDILNKAREMFPRSEMYSDDVIGMFDQMSTQGGFTYGDTILKFYGQEGSTPKGNFKDENAGIEFASRFRNKVLPGGSYKLSARIANQINAQQSIGMAMDAIHETMHQAGFDDEQLALATVQVLGPAAEADLNKLMKGRVTFNDRTIGFSSWFNHRLSEKCDTFGNRRPR